ncbi:hypothetical protein SDJN03_19398, partial [Cucurbita argyrosperma subsp. sororia]
MKENTQLVDEDWMSTNKKSQDIGTECVRRSRGCFGMEKYEDKIERKGKWKGKRGVVDLARNGGNSVELGHEDLQ